MSEESSLKSGYHYIIGDLRRLGVITFMARLEKEHYNEDDRFHLVGVHRYAGHPYVIFGIPIREDQIVHTLAEECNLRLINGKPLIVGGEDFRFSYSEDSIFTLENISHQSTDCYIRDLLKERETVNRMFS